MMTFKTSKGNLMRSLTISMFLRLIKGDVVTPSESLPRLYQSSLSPIPHVGPPSSLKKSTAVRYDAAGNGLIWLKIGEIAPMLPTPQRETDERGVKKSRTQPKPRSLVAASSSEELRHKPSVFEKTALTSLTSLNHTKSTESILEEYLRLKVKSPAFPFTRHRTNTKLHSRNRRYGTKGDNARDTKHKKKNLRDSDKNRQPRSRNDSTDERSNPMARRSVETGEHHMLEGLLDQYATSFGTKQEMLDEENTINKIEELNKLSTMAPRDLNSLDERRNNLRDLDVSVGDMEPWEQKDYDGESLQRSRVVDVRKYVKREEPFLNTFVLRERKVRDALPDYFERFPKPSKLHGFPAVLPFNRARPIKRFPELPSITEQEREIFPSSDLFLPGDDAISDEYAAHREPLAPEEDQPLDEPEPAPEAVPEPEPAPIPELPSIKEIPPIREPEAPPAPNLDPKKTFDTGESNGGEKKTLQTKEQ